jgi:hypothetical protein
VTLPPKPIVLGVAVRVVVVAVVTASGVLPEDPVKLESPE